MMLLALTLFAHAADAEAPILPHTPHAEIGVSAAMGPRAPFAGLSGGWDGRAELMARAELWPHTRADALEDIGAEVRRPLSHSRFQLRAGYDVIPGVRVGAVMDAEHGVGRPYRGPDFDPDRGGNLFLGGRTAIGPTFDAVQVRGVLEVLRTPTRQSDVGREFGSEWRTWLDLDIHHKRVVYSAQLGAGKRGWRYLDENAAATTGLNPVVRLTLGTRI